MNNFLNVQNMDEGVELKRMFSFKPGSNLSEAEFNRIELEGANLTRANLSNTNLTKAKLTGANLIESVSF